MPFLHVLSIVFPVFSIIGLGYLFARLRRIGLEPLIEVLLYITIPALVISSMIKRELILGDLFIVSISACGVVLGTGLMSFLYLSAIKRKELRGFYLPTMFMNSGNMAFPLSLLAFGEDGLAIAVIYYVTIGILVSSLGVYVAKGKGGFSEIFKLPLIYASIIGIVINLGDLSLPEPIIDTMDILGGATIPLMLITLGYSLYSISLASINLSIAGVVIRMGGGILTAYILVNLLGVEGLNRKVILLASAMPSAVINFIMTQRYRLNPELVASIILLSTLISLLATPLLLAILI